MRVAWWQPLILLLHLVTPLPAQDEGTHSPGGSDAPSGQASAQTATSAPPSYVAIVRVSAQSQPEQAGDELDAADPTKVITLFRAGDIVGGKAFVCRASTGASSADPPAAGTPPSATASNKRTAPAVGIKDIASILECLTDPKNSLRDRLGALSRLDALIAIEPVRKASRYPRAIAGRTDRVRVVVLRPATVIRSKNDKTPLLVRGPAAVIRLKEDERASRISTDLETLAAVAARIATGARALVPYVSPGETESAAGTWYEERTHTLTLGRATLQISVALDGAMDTTLVADFSKEDLTRFQEEERRDAAGADHARKLKAQSALAAAAIRTFDDECKKPLQPATPPVIRFGCTVTSNRPVEERVMAAIALGTLGDGLAVAPLSCAIDDPTSPASLRAAAMTALSKVQFLPAPAATAPTEAKRPSSDPQPPQKPPAVAATINTGSAEHWYLSADVPLTGETKVTFDDKTGAVKGIADPSAFYIGVGYQLGDLLTQHRNPLHGLSVKVLVKGSSRPLDSYGVAVALRSSYLSRLGLDFDVVSPFVAYMSTREVPEDTTTVPQSTERHESWLFGLSLNLDAAMAWLKK